MFVIINPRTNECHIFRYKSALALILKCSVRTITRHIDDVKWSINDWDIYNPQTIHLRGKNRGKNV
jgi:hypothetical protein